MSDVHQQTCGFEEALACTEDFANQGGMVILRDGVVQLRVRGTCKVGARSLFFWVGASTDVDKTANSPFAHLSTYKDVLEGKRELFILARDGVICLQLEHGAKVHLGGGFQLKERLPSRFPQCRDFNLDPHG